MKGTKKNKFPKKEEFEEGSYLFNDRYEMGITSSNPFRSSDPFKN